jgi:CheY-like chemotaxis protein
MLALFQQLFADVKNNIHDSADNIRAELTKAIGAATMNVIVADDDDDDYEFFSEAMCSIMPGIQVKRACDGVELISLLENLQQNMNPNVIFLDLNMPFKNGFECLDIIKHSKTWKDIPVIIYSTSANTEQVDLTYRNGANLYVQKPNSFVDIKKIVKRIFELGIQELSSQPAKEKYILKL